MSGSIGGSSGGSTNTGGGANDDPCGEPQVDLTTLDLEALPEGVTRLSEGWGWPRSVDVYGSDLYAISGTTLYVVRNGSSEREEIATNLPETVGTYTNGRNALQVDATHAYFVTKVGISRAVLETGVVETIFDEVTDGIPTDIVLTDEFVVFGVYPNGGIYRAPLTGDAPPTLVTDQLSPLGMTATNDTIYAANSNDVLSKIPLAGGTPSPVRAGTKPLRGSQMTVRDGRLYWSNVSVMSCDVTHCITPTDHGGTGHGLELRGDRFYRGGETLTWGAIDGGSCGNVVYGDFPDTLGLFGVTDDFVYLFVEVNFGLSGNALLRVDL